MVNKPTANAISLQRWLQGLFPWNWVPYAPTVLDNYSQQYANVPFLANKFQYLSNQRDIFSPSEQNIVWLYNQFSDNQNPYYQRIMDINKSLNNENLWRLNDLKNHINTQYWPDGLQTKQLNGYYDYLANYYATQSGNDKARINADTVGTWASIGQGRAAMSDLEQKMLQNSLQVQNNKFKDYKGVYDTYTNYLNDIYWKIQGSNDRYIKWAYDQINWQQQALWNNLFNNLQNLEAQRAQYNMQTALRNAVPKARVAWAVASANPYANDVYNVSWQNPSPQHPFVDPIYAPGTSNENFSPAYMSVADGKTLTAYPIDKANYDKYIKNYQYK